MRHRNLWIGALLVMAGAATSAWAEDRDVEAPRKDGNWFTRLFAKPAPPVEPKREDAKPTTTPRVTPDVQPISAMTTLLRRQRVCDKLREIALETGNDNLLRQANELEQRAFEAYREQMARLTTPRGTLDPSEQSLRNDLGLSATPDSLPNNLVRRGTPAPARSARRTEP